MGSAEVGGKIFLTTNVLLKYEKVRINVKKDNNELMEHFFKLHSKWSQNAITVREELAMQYRSLEKAMKMDSTALMEHFLSLLIGESSTVKEEYPDESLDSLTSQPTQSVSIGEASTPPVMEYHNTSLSQDGSTSASPRNLVQIRDTALCSTSSIAAIKNPGALYTNNQSSCVPTVHIPLDSGVLLPHLSGTSSFSHTFSQKRKLSSSSDGDVPASKIPGIQHHIHHLHPPQSSGEPLQQESIPDRRSLIEGTTGQHLFGYQTGSTRNDYGKPSATFSLQDVEQQQNHGLRTAALPSDLSKDSRRDISKTALDFIEGVSQLTSVDNVHSLRLSVDRVSMGSIVGSEPLERQNVLGMNMSPQFAKGLRQNRVSMDNSVNIHPQPGTSGVNQNISGSMTEFDLSAVKIEVNSDEDLEDVSHESGDQEALAAMVTDAELSEVSGYIETGSQYPPNWEYLRGTGESRNTQSKTINDLNIMQKYLSQKGEHRAIENIPLKTLDDYISAFLNTGRKKDGSEYSYASLRSFLSTLERYLRQKNVFQGSIFQGIHFQKCRSVLKVKKMLCGPSKTRDFGEITEAALDHLYKRGYLGMSTPSSLINSMLIICYQSFGLKTGVEMYTLRWKDVQVGVDEYGKEYLAYIAVSEKTSLNIHWSNNYPRAYATSNNPNMDPVALYRMYGRKRPDDMCEPKSPFFLAFNPRVPSYDTDTLWFKTTAMGIKALYSTMNDIRAQLCMTRRH